MRMLALRMRLWENYTVGLDKLTAFLQRWTEMAAVNSQTSTTLRPAVAYLAQQSKEKKKGWRVSM